MKIEFIVCALSQHKNEQGLHLTNASTVWDINEVLISAWRENRFKIYLHYDVVAELSYAIPYSILNRLSDLFQLKEIKIVYVHPKL